MEVKHGKNMFYIGEDEKQPLAKMTYVPSGERTIIVDHTLVTAELKGQGAGQLLLKHLVEWARSSGMKVVPMCSFAKAQMEKTPEYHDVLK